MKLARVSHKVADLVPRRDPTVQDIARSWRMLTGGTARDRDPARRTLIACSGGGDSSGLAIALAAAVSKPADLFTLCHIIHDMRPRAQALADRDAARDLADRLGLPFVESHIHARPEGGNLEAAARRLRYRALQALANREACPYIATAHHAEDQFETILMALVRGAGPTGLSGIPRKRTLDGSSLIRPALGVSRADLQRLCATARWQWREDATNLDTSRLRSAIRIHIIPELERLKPGVSRRASQSASLMRSAANIISRATDQLLSIAATTDGLSWKRDTLRAEPPIILGELLRAAAHHLDPGRGRDRLTSRALAPIIRAIRDHSTEPRETIVGGIVVHITSRSIRIRKRTSA